MGGRERVKNKFFEYIHDNPIIGAVTDMDRLDEVIASPCKIVFLLMGDILNIERMVEVLKENGKLVYLHIDLLGGVSRDNIALKYIYENVRPDGIITTKSNLVRTARDLNLFTVQRLFLLDSLALESGIKSIKTAKPDAVEVLPGIIPKLVEEIKRETRVPIVAGGLIKDKTDVFQVLNAGAIGVSTSKTEVWHM